jgi:hypothetical protein
MLLSYVSIANTSLGHIGEDDRISDPDEDSRAAREVRVAWEPIRLFVLADAHWSEATRTIELVARPDDPTWPIALGRTAFPLPPNFVSLAEIVDPELNDDDDEFALEAGPNGVELLVEGITGPITVRCVLDLEPLRDPSRWSVGFAEAFAFRLAWQISDPLAADKGRKDRAENNYLKALRKARKNNARTKPFRRNPPSDWARARHSCRTDRFIR